MHTEALTPTLTQLTFPVGQAYLLSDGREATLVDTGPHGHADAIRALLGRIPLRRIVLTHCHGDHTGNAAELAAWSGAEVLAHQADVAAIGGEAPPPPVFTADWEEARYRQTSVLVPPAPPCRVDTGLTGGEVLPLAGGTRVLPVPGHTPGSLALLTAAGTLFTGDAVANVERLSVGVFNADPAAAVAATRHLATLDFTRACFGHGPALHPDAAARFRALAATLG
ncbi:glyoxylase-like metal-dependent hydrolase (beta-lactamase superfamily II) [Crossiella equi]|uniref:Glyoxylase-like metal-dependent hydrolase (Beta-lactamase superfamily II) n=1 Tax=Crossiella equi TaxID=130796 RepID=A0ABS5A8A5_9PSEU|nr:MBL fold metallo-hydrolase [Crossiella equi]MBP2472829.1 glyoxylase-like metal-dependent hydrolase (beta-lactamase superfamily II) [Crossiella equi]